MTAKPQPFKEICQKFGRHDIEFCASHIHKPLDKYVSQYTEAGAVIAAFLLT